MKRVFFKNLFRPNAANDVQLVTWNFVSWEVRKLQNELFEMCHLQQCFFSICQLLWPREVKHVFPLADPPWRSDLSCTQWLKNWVTFLLEAVEKIALKSAFFTLSPSFFAKTDKPLAKIAFFFLRRTSLRTYTISWMHILTRLISTSASAAIFWTCLKPSM